MEKNLLCNHFIILWMLFHVWMEGDAQVCQGDSMFEKVVNFFTPEASRPLLQGVGDQPVTKDCLLLCRQASDCLGFALNYTTRECLAVITVTDASTIRSSLVPTRGTNFFQKICTHSDFKACKDLPWVFVRVPGAFLNVSEGKTYSDVTSSIACEEICLEEKEFLCRSANYDSRQRTCILNKADRRSRPQLMQEDSTRDYLENQCAEYNSINCHYETTFDTTVSSTDAIATASSLQDCEKLCDQNVQSFCRSYSFENVSKLCYISGDDVISVGNVTSKQGSVYGERHCISENCTTATTVFERVTGKLPRGVSTRPAKSVGSGSDITSTCLERCHSAGAQCAGMIVDYSNFACQLVERSGATTSGDFTGAASQSYYEKLCLSELPASCGSKTWLMERVPGFQLDGFDDRIFTGIMTRSACADACVQEKGFVCRSAEFLPSDSECRLSRNDRRTQPSAFIPVTDDRIDYLENQCVPAPENCTFNKQSDFFPTYIDKIKANVTSEQECKLACTNSAEFTCLSVGYRLTSRDCLLSSVDQIIGGRSSSQMRPETVYLERKCITTPIPAELPELNDPVVTMNPSFPHQPPWAAIPGRCDNTGSDGIQMFEKTTGVTMGAGDVIPLYAASIPGITEECQKKCLEIRNCNGFVVDYMRVRCFTFTGFDIAFTRGVLLTAPASSYFETTCFKAVRGCNRLWTFERVMNKGLQGFIREIIVGVTKIVCEERCFTETKFICRSATYDYTKGECRLSTENRFTQPQFYTSLADTDYLENQCTDMPAFLTGIIMPRDLSQVCRAFQRFPGKLLLFAERSTTVGNQEECEKMCLSNEDFTCRSYSFIKNPRYTSGECFLCSAKADDLGMELQDVPDGTYVETSCEYKNVTEHENFTNEENHSLSDPPFPTVMINSGSGASSDCTATHYSLERTAGMSPVIRNTGTLNSTAVVGSTKECIRKCNQNGKSCMAFVQRIGSPCLSYDSPINRNELRNTPGAVYYEKSCIRVAGCGKLWTFDRVIGYELSGSRARQISNVATLQECEELCLQEGTFVCRSATYWYSIRECHLSHHSRHTRPKKFRFIGMEVDYVENQCAPLK